MQFRFLVDKQGDALIRGWTNDRRLFLRVFGLSARFEVGRVSGVRWLEFRWGGGYTNGLQVCGGFGYGMWATLELPWSLMRRLPGWPLHDAREVGLNHSHGSLRVKVGRKTMGGYYGGPWLRRWRNLEFTLFDLEWLVGRDKVTREQLMEPRRALIPIGEWPGDTYTVEVSAEKMTWRNRVRSRSRKYWDFRTPDGEKAPPIPGKGENSWDIDDDAIYALSVAFEEDPIPAYKRRIIEARRRYSSPGWRPRDVAEARA